jgi:hypothetical protein
MLAHHHAWCVVCSALRHIHAMPLVSAPQLRRRCVAGYDLVGIAATGSGKTLAFVRHPPPAALQP